MSVMSSVAAAWVNTLLSVAALTAVLAILLPPIAALVVATALGLADPARMGPLAFASGSLGTLIGASIGGSVGRSMDEVDRMKVGATLETTRTGVTTRWENPDTGHEYAVTPTRTYETAEGPCREYTMDAQIGGRTEQVYGTACRQPDGSWRIVE
jgi:surface antigen